MINVTSNVGSRLIDVSLGDIAPGTGYSRHDIDLSGGKVTTGMQKLVDRFILTLFTISGSTKHDQNFGTRLLPNVSVGSSLNFGSVQSSVAVAVSRAKSQIKNDDSRSENAGVPDDEKLESAECTGVNYNVKSGALQIYVSLTSRAGENYTYVLPVNLSFPA